MAMNITLSEQSERIVRAKMADHGSADAVIETALAMLQDTNCWNDPEYLEYVRLAVEEAEADNAPAMRMSREAFTQSFHRMWAELQGGGHVQRNRQDSFPRHGGNESDFVIKSEKNNLIQQ
ncbi:MAG: hypothetical protein HQM03_12195 [Magnetococcales bacterium]|nr:hypothetical protein [Magnetococcales bacterium]